MINLEVPKKLPCWSARRTSPRPRSSGRTPASTTGLSTSIPRNSTCSPRHRRHERRRGRRDGARGVRRDTDARRQDQDPQRRQPGHRARHHRDVLGRRRPAALHAPPGPRQRRDRLGGQRRAAEALRRQVGRDGHHRARLRLGLRRHPHHRRARRRRVHAQRREDLRHAGERADAVVVWATLDRAKGRAAIKSFVVEKDGPGFELVRLEHKLGIRASDTAHIRFRTSGYPRPTCSATRRSMSNAASQASCRPSTTPARWSRAWRRLRPGRAGGDARPAGRGGPRRSTTTRRPAPTRRLAPS